MEYKDFRLFGGDLSSYQHTARLEALLNADMVDLVEDEDGDWVAPSGYTLVEDQDIRELFAVYESGGGAVGYTPTLRDFCHWVLGDGEYDQPCEVGW